jgi:hypothetical protein
MMQKIKFFLRISCWTHAQVLRLNSGKGQFVLFVITNALQIGNSLDVCGSAHHTVQFIKKSNKMQQCIKILLFHIYMKLNVFRATHRPSSGA